MRGRPVGGRPARAHHFPPDPAAWRESPRATRHEVSIVTPQEQALMQRVIAELRQSRQETHAARIDYAAFRQACENAPKSITEEIDSIPGRRIFYNLNGVQTFTAANATTLGQRGQPINFLVSQDGPFIMCFEPEALWMPSAPDTTPNFGRWRPVFSYPLPDQVVDTDIIDISWELVDTGSQRNFQNLPSPPSFSRPDLLIPLAVPTLFAPNTTIQFFPTFNDITFSGDPENPPTDGLLWVRLPGYRIVSL